jgi:hypothetical protein
MDMGGWKTRSVFKRYAINSNADQLAAVQKLEQARAHRKTIAPFKAPETETKVAAQPAVGSDKVQ